jgi:DNA-directed RNA polymerase specialized sigma24 family protein
VASLLFHMARNKLIDRAREEKTAKRGGRHRSQAEQEPVDGLPSREGDPGELLAGRDLVLGVRERLDEPNRQLLDRWLSGVEWARIAEEVGGSAEALRKQLSRAIDGIARDLGLIEGKS